MAFEKLYDSMRIKSINNIMRRYPDNWNFSYISKLSKNNISYIANQLTKAKINPSMKVNRLNLSNLQAGVLSGSALTSLVNAMASNTTITTLYLNNSGIDDNVAGELAKIFSKNKTLQNLYLEKNKITNVGISSIARALVAKENFTLKKLIIQGNSNVFPYGARNFLISLQPPPTLSPEDRRILAYITQNASSTKWDFTNQNITGNGAKTIVGEIKRYKQMEILALGYNMLFNTGVRAIADELKKNSTLKYIGLQGNNITDKGGITVLADALKQNTTLLALWLDGNKITDDGAIALAEALKQNKTLISLSLSGNNISYEGAKVIVEALEENKKLIYLNLNNNRRMGGDSEAGDIITALINGKNTTLISLYINNNNYEFDRKKIQPTTTIKTTPPPTTTITTTTNPPTTKPQNAEARRVSDLIKQQSNEYWNFNQKNITSIGAKVIADLLKTNTTLDILSLHSNKIGDEGAKVIAEALKTNKKLTALY